MGAPCTLEYLKGDDVRDLLDPVVWHDLDEVAAQPHVSPLADQILEERVVGVLHRPDPFLRLRLRLFRRCLRLGRERGVVNAINIIRYFPQGKSTCKITG